MERKHQEAATLIRRVREFSGNVQNATNLGRGVERIFQRVEAMAAGMADRLLSEIAAANTLTVRPCHTVVASQYTAVHEPNILSALFFRKCEKGLRRLFAFFRPEVEGRAITLRTPSLRRSTRPADTFKG